MDSPVRFIGTVQLGITPFSILLGGVGGPIVGHWTDEPLLSTTLAFLIAFSVVTYLHVTLGELVPKAIALTKNESTALWVALPVEAVYVVSYPVVWLSQFSTNPSPGLSGTEPAPAGVVAHTEEDIRHIVAAAEDTGVIEPREEEMVYKVFDFADKEVHEVMVPRPEVVALSVELPPQEALAAMIDSPYTRYPVYRGSLDDIVGILHVRDLFSALYDRGIENVEIEELVRDGYVVPETKDLAAMLAEFRRTNQHMALVIDEYGSFQGIVTLEDLLEEIVGEIEDEYDLPNESLEKLDDRRIRIDGTFPIDDFNQQFEQELPQEEYHTVAGFVFGQLGRAAQEGDEVLHDGLRFSVLEVDGPRIEKLEIEFIPEERSEEAQAAD